VNVVLVGYRGTGKSCVARVVGELLGWDVISLDAEIVRRAGQSIAQFVADRGWDGFRDLEEEVCRSAAAGSRRVLDCGGGVVERRNNIAVLRAAGRVFWLSATPETIVERIQGDDQRPALTAGRSHTEEVAEVLARRVPLYRMLAHVTVCTDSRSVEQIAREIVAHMQTHLAGSRGSCVCPRNR
jgi:shikimate kinase